MFLKMLSGVALLIFGTRSAGEGFQRLFDSNLKTTISNLTKNRLTGVTIGALIALLFQSSAAAVVMIMNFVSTGIISMLASLGLLLGTDIGTTLVIQLISLKIYQYSIIIAGVGITVKYLATNKKAKNFGEGVLGFAFIFLAISVIVEAFEPLKGNKVLVDILTGLEGGEAIISVFLAAILTALVGSSTVVISILISLAINSIITLNLAFPMVLGANLGTCVVAFIASMGSDAPAKRVMWSHFAFKLTGVALFIPFIDAAVDLMRYVTDDPVRQIANSHTFINLIIVAVFLPFIGVVEKIMIRLVPEKISNESEEMFGAKYLDEKVLGTPALAFGQVAREAMRMVGIVQSMLEESIKVFETNDIQLLQSIEERDDRVDLIDHEIKLYITKLIQSSLTRKESRRELELISFTAEMEHIGDIIDKNILELAKKKIKHGLVFSREGFTEIKTFHKVVSENFTLAISAFTERDGELARRAIRQKSRIKELERTLRENHINRLHQGLKESFLTSSIHLDLISYLERINYHISNIAYPIIESKTEKDDE